jgi:hypothetical protein
MRKRNLITVLTTLLAVNYSSFLTSAHGDVQCLQITNSVVGGKVVSKFKKVTRVVRCKIGEIAVPTEPSGDGSAGAKTVSANEILSDTNTMFTDITINSGVTWTIPSGTIIRCSGNLTNNGTINVIPSGIGGLFTGTDTDTLAVSATVPAPGISLRAPAAGELGDSNSNRSGGAGGLGISEIQAANIRTPGIVAGGAGAGFFSLDNSDGAGGGGLAIICNKNILNNGVISANGNDGNTSSRGGGGGGVIILASKTSAVSSADSVISATGGDGGRATSSTGPSGGGGGGVIHIMAPDVNTTGALVSVDGGTAGVISTTVSATIRGGGSGGGASGGNGGKGGTLPLGQSTPDPASNGSAGHIIYSLFDPMSQF